MNIGTMTRSELLALRDDADAKLANLTAQIDAIRSELTAKLSGLSTDEQRLRTTIGQASAELARREALDAIEPTITDHALLRYMERVHGIDIAALKSSLLNEAMIRAIKSGASAMKTPEGVFVIRGASVTTFLSHEMRPKRKTKRGMVNHDDDSDDHLALAICRSAGLA